MLPHPALSPRCYTGNVNGAGRGIKGEGPGFFHTSRKFWLRVSNSNVAVAFNSFRIRSDETMLRTLVFLPLTLCLVAARSSYAAPPLREFVISGERGIHLDEWKVSNYDVLLKRDPAFSVKKTTLRGGRQEGVDLITITHSRLKLVIVPTRGMGLLQAEGGDVRLG